MNIEQCRLFEECEAPLCPLEENSIKHGIWYPDEEICRAKKFQSLKWIKRQKRIAKLGLTIDSGLFTARMLESLRRVSKGIKGANPDNIDSEQKWLEQRGLEELKNTV